MVAAARPRAVDPGPPPSTQVCPLPAAPPPPPLSASLEGRGGGGRDRGRGARPQQRRRPSAQAPVRIFFFCFFFFLFFFSFPALGAPRANQFGALAHTLSRGPWSCPLPRPRPLSDQTSAPHPNSPRNEHPRITHRLPSISHHHTSKFPQLPSGAPNALQTTLHHLPNCIPKLSSIDPKAVPPICLPWTPKMYK